MAQAAGTPASAGASAPASTPAVEEPQESIDISLESPEASAEQGLDLSFGMPSIWAWQILWWALGCFMMWFLAYKMELSTVPETEIQSLYEDIGDVHEATDEL